MVRVQITSRCDQRDWLEDQWAVIDERTQPNYNRRAYCRPSAHRHPGAHMPYTLHRADCLDWMKQQPEASIEAIVTDPPYGLKEYSTKEQGKLRNGHRRAPLPRFTVLTRQELDELTEFFRAWGKLTLRVAVPGAHLFIATNPLLSHMLYAALTEAGWEKRGEIVRLVQTLRGGDRPKNAESEFPMPR
ncbi:MAG: hypothetical protein U0232_14025 [Thermomicrobiales bacterium]